MGYLIELRIGYPLKLLKQGILDIAEKYQLTHQQPETAHMSLFGSFEPKKGVSIGMIKNEIEHFAGKYDKFRYYIDGFACKYGDGGWAIAYHVIPSDDLREFNEAIRPRLWKLTKNFPKFMLKDARDEWYHITIAFRLTNSLKESLTSDLGEVHFIDDNGRCVDIQDCSNSQNDEPVIRPHFLPIDSLRITLLHGSKIFAEYDLVRKKWYTRDQAKNVEVVGETYRTYRRQNGLEIHEENHFSDPTIFLASDLHFGHSNIIKYCARPFLFSRVNEMDNVLVRNWNNRIKPEDSVYFLGDLSYSKKYSTLHYLNKLNGKIHFIRGNLDDDSVHPTIQQQILHYNSQKFLLTHDPNDEIPSGFNGWIIHGHKHNRELKDYPLIDFTNKRINICPELTNYQPIRLELLYNLIMENDEDILFLDGLSGFRKKSEVFDS